MKIYLSHYIRGTKKHPDKDANYYRAIQFAEDLRFRWPFIHVYVPAEHDEFIQKALDSRYLSVDEVLELDCEIIGGCNGVVFYMDEEMSEGMRYEYDFCNLHGTPVLIVNYTDCMDVAQERLETFLLKLAKETSCE